ncbi:MAG: hypothetical protein AAGC55_33055, partial [Myxococcota bacterium]
MPAPILSFRCSERLSRQADVRAKRDGTNLSVVLRALLAEYTEGRRPTIEVARTLDAIRAE